MLSEMYEQSSKLSAELYKYLDSDDELDICKVTIDKTIGRAVISKTYIYEPSYISKFFNIIDYLFSFPH
tara:strand:+ start:509 stop:715 length:207 start_codon:yes stop_codon:yes gene_type:complete